MDMFAHLEAERSGVHMSRFIENIEGIASMMATESSPDIETMAERMAMAISTTQGTRRAEVRIRAQFPMVHRAPVSGASVEDLYTFIGIAISDGHSARRAIGVEATGLTVCPCAREMVSEYTRSTLLAAGYSSSQADEITSIVPLASHNQRGKGTLVIGTQIPLRAEQLVSITLGAMSSEIYELLKRPDELHVVRKAHSRPRFVEDVVREMIGGVAEQFAGLPDDVFVLARQENFESIHIHNASAERCGLLGDMRRELSGDGRAARPSFSSLEAWLESLL
jgi:GTP cyclohydrolase-4